MSRYDLTDFEWRRMRTGKPSTLWQTDLDGTLKAVDLTLQPI
jgi:hypothetical protein